MRAFATSPDAPSDRPVRRTHPVERLLRMSALAPATRLHADKNGDKGNDGCLVRRHASSSKTALSAGP